MRKPSRTTLWSSTISTRIAIAAPPFVTREIPSRRIYIAGLHCNKPFAGCIRIEFATPHEMRAVTFRQSLYLKEVSSWFLLLAKVFVWPYQKEIYLGFLS